jgi:hypothetical protein
MGKSAAASGTVGASASWCLAGRLIKLEVSAGNAGQHDAADRQEHSPAIYEPNGARIAVKPGTGHGHPDAFFDLTAHCRLSHREYGAIIATGKEADSSACRLFSGAPARSRGLTRRGAT